MLDIVKEHVYLGTIISENGKRNEEIKKRTSESKSGSNEIVLILKTTELSQVRLNYHTMLGTSCVDGKLKYGSAVWNKLNQTQIKDLNSIKINMVKRVLELPYSTPSVVVQYEFGIIDFDLEVLLEKVLLYFETLHREPTDIGKRLLVTMMKKKVPGYCRKVQDALDVLNIIILN